MEVTESQVQAEISALEREAAADAASQPTPAAPGVEGANTSYQEHGPSEQALEWQEILQPLLWGGFAILAPAWNITAEETQQMAEAYEPLCAKYMPDGPGKWGPEIAAAFVTVHVLAPRLGKPRKLPSPDQEKGQEGNQEAGQAHQGEKPGESQGKPQTTIDGDVEVSAATVAGVDA